MFIHKGFPKALNSIQLLIFVLLFGFFAESNAQDWRIGQGKKFSISQASSPPLRIKSVGQASLSSYRFVGAVGGVNFEKTAAPSPGESYQTISIAYDLSKQDGQRLTVLLDNSQFNVMLPDWQLIPIARFANSEFTGVLSLFGEGPDKERYYYIQYHEAFKNTLLGLRLLQADILFIDLGNHWDLPRQQEHQVLGLGESVPNRSASVFSMQRLNQILQSHTWRSWVLTDIETIPQFSISGSQFRVTASPYYFFWDTKQTTKEQMQLSQKYNKLFSTYESLIDEYNTKVAQYNNTRQSVTVRNRIDSELHTLKTQIRGVEGALKRLQNQLENPTVREVSALTSAMRSQASALQQYNPAVYNAYINTAAFSAFFRYVKKKNPTAWNRFMNSIKGVNVLPSVQTPTTWER